MLWDYEGLFLSMPVVAQCYTQFIQSLNTPGVQVSRVSVDFLDIPPLLDMGAECLAELLSAASTSGCQSLSLYCHSPPSRDSLIRAPLVWRSLEPFQMLDVSSLTSLTLDVSVLRNRSCVSWMMVALIRAPIEDLSFRGDGLGVRVWTQILTEVVLDQLQSLSIDSPIPTAPFLHFLRAHKRLYSLDLGQRVLLRPSAVGPTSLQQPLLAFLMGSAANLSVLFQHFICCPPKLRSLTVSGEDNPKNKHIAHIAAKVQDVTSISLISREDDDRTARPSPLRRDTRSAYRQD